MHDVPNGNMEAEANLFAAEFLMPKRDVSPQLDGLTLERLAALKPYWRVSMAALLFRAAELKKVSARAGKFLWIQMSPYKRREPVEIAAEKPALLRDIIEIHRTAFGYGITEFADMLLAKPDELTAMYGLNQTPSEVKTRLRVVKNSQSSAG